MQRDQGGSIGGKLLLYNSLQGQESDKKDSKVDLHLVLIAQSFSLIEE